jgi:murein DD-endopeptidase MepM/ murein hydrolase activator NlpD
MAPFFIRACSVLVVMSTSVPIGVADAGACWPPPVDAPITDLFRPPTCTWCPGNRGIEYGTSRGAPVRAVATGRVSYAGSIAGTVYVVIRHGDGRRVTYGNLLGESFDVGDLVVRGQIIGRAGGRLHLGVRDGERYVDPARFIGRLVSRARLVPVDGSRPNPAPPPRLSCAAGAGSANPVVTLPTRSVIRRADHTNQPLVPTSRSPRRPERVG